jgi:hypothetical protein
MENHGRHQLLQPVCNSALTGFHRSANKALKPELRKKRAAHLAWRYV